MLTGEDMAVLNEAYRNSKMGVEAINAIISKVYDEDLALDLNRQAVRFLSFEDKVTEKIRERISSRRPPRRWEKPCYGPPFRPIRF